MSRFGVFCGRQPADGHSRFGTALMRLIQLAAWCIAVALLPLDAAAVTPRLVKDITAGPGSNGIFQPSEFQNKFLFSANDGMHGSEMWSSDGTDAGTTIIKDINAGAASSSPANYTQVGDHLYFKAVTDTAGSELWVTDGTDAGTTLVKDIFPGPTGSNPSLFERVGNLLVFVANDGTGVRFWRTDGTAAGTQAIPGDVIQQGTSGILSVVPHNGAIYTRTLADDYRYSWIYKTDGYTVSLVKTFSSHPDRGWPLNMISSYNYLYFLLDTYTLWRSDGTPDGTQPVAFVGIDSHTTPFANLNGLLLMNCSAQDGYLHEPYKWDGTAVTLIKDVYPISRSRPSFVSGEWRGHIFFQANGPTQRSLWITDGTTAGTREYFDFGGTYSQPTDPRVTIVEEYDYAIIQATTAQHGRELWITYSLDSAPTLLFDLNPGPTSSNPSAFKIIGNRMFFAADDGIVGKELWVFDLPGPAAATDWQHFE